MAAFAAAAVAVTPSCTKTVQPDSFNQEVTLQENAALEEFAAVLSKVVTGSEEVRAFFKDEALKQFDRDFDVFYPYVKDHKFSSGETLREMLVANETYEGQIETIERAVPKLTVLIPSYSWIGENSFDVHTWDTADNHLCVGFDDRALEHSLYYDGEMMGTLAADAIPSFPVMIVKSNERMKVSISTKGGENTYSFADPAFDGSSYGEETKGYWEGYIYNASPKEDDLFSLTGDFISQEELDGINPDVIKAYKEFSTGSTAGVQRDYIYYGMKKNFTQPGTLNRNMRDMLYRFRLTPAAMFFCADAPVGNNRPGDPALNTQFWTGRDDRPDFAHAAPRFWADGSFEMRLEFYQAYPGSGAACIGTIALSLAPSEIMRINKIAYTYEQNFWGNNWSSYRITRDDVESKWYYPGDKNNPLPVINSPWNLAVASDNLYMRVYEFDASGTTTIKKGKTFKQSWSVTANVSGELGSGKDAETAAKIGLGVSGSYGEETVWADECTYSIVEGNDDLLDCEICYIDNYILHPSMHGGKKQGYEMKAWGNEYFSASFIPVDTRKEAQIKRFLLGRKSRLNQ